MSNKLKIKFIYFLSYEIYDCLLLKNACHELILLNKKAFFRHFLSNPIFKRKTLPYCERKNVTKSEKRFKCREKLGFFDSFSTSYKVAFLNK